MTEQTARTIAAKLLADLTDRRGFRQVWESLDDDVHEEINESWVVTILVEAGLDTESPRTDGVSLIAAERRRQVEEEGWAPEHDAEHTDESMAQVAAYYALPEGSVHSHHGSLWPSGWDPKWNKKGAVSRRRLLVMAGALLAAEIDRLAVVGEAETKPQAQTPATPDSDFNHEGVCKAAIVSALAEHLREGMVVREAQSVVDDVWKIVRERFAVVPVCPETTEAIAMIETVLGRAVTDSPAVVEHVRRFLGLSQGDDAPTPHAEHQPQRRTLVPDVLIRAEAYKLHAEALLALHQAMAARCAGSGLWTAYGHILDSMAGLGGETDELRKELKDARWDVKEARRIAQFWKDYAVDLGHEDDLPLPGWME